MKKLTFLFLLMFCAAAFSQELPRIAVYVTGDDIDENMKTALGTRMLASLVNSGRYSGIERNRAFLAEIDKEHLKQRSGEVDDNQISQLGRQFGVGFVCIVNITPILGDFQVSARIVNVETAEIAFIGESFGPLKTVDDLESASDRVADGMFGRQTRAREPEPVLEVPAPPADRGSLQPPETDTPAQNGRKHDFYAALRYLPFAGPVNFSSLAYNSEFGVIWDGGFFLGADYGYAYSKSNRHGAAKFTGGYADVGSVHELTPKVKFAYGVSAGYGRTEHYDVSGQPSYDSSSVLVVGPFVRLRLRAFELSYRVLFGNLDIDNKDAEGNPTEQGTGFGISHQLGLGVYFEGSKRKKKY